MDQPAEVCETYQLKWSYYNSYMHSCISTSLYNDSFADVALVTTDGHQVMAHRYILSYSSRYFAQILKYQRKVTTALPLMIVMPPEIDYKALKVLLRYMYSGEAKVPKEILKSVLHGGDVLQIKGLYREKDENDKSLKLVQTNQSFQSPFNSTPTNTPATTPTPLISSSPPPLISTVITDQKVLKKIITPATGTTTAPLAQKTSTTSASTTASSATPTSSGQNSSAKNDKKVLPKFLIVQKPKEHQLIANTKNKAKVLNFTLLSNSEQNALKKTCETESQIDEVVVKTEPVIRESNLQYLMIKDEPVDWSEADMEVIDSEEVYEDIQCKSEHENSSFDEEEKMFSPLTCELCTETFTVPKEWVRHVQTHTDMLPAKRRRRDSTGGSDSYENDTFPELMCDLCQKAFSTPAEWVKHIQSAHTEFELHLSNKKITSDSSKNAKFRNTSQNSQSSEQGKLCTDCNKTFPSNASMLIHKRSHTGEKPFSCEWCPKTFNVKSNLLRHLRTIHDKIINATELDNKEEGNCINVESY